MIIGLVRHFKVEFRNYKPSYYPDEFRKAMQDYDEAGIILGNNSYNEIKWEICISSSLKRAVETANHIYKGEIQTTDLLREVSLAPFTSRQLKLPWFVWHAGARISWARNGKSQEETRKETYERIEKIYSEILNANKEYILIVSHGFFMKCFSKFLVEKGFKGSIDEIPRNGKLYIYKN